MSVHYSDCQSKKTPITAQEFHHLNRCLDIAIAGAVTKFETSSVSESKKREAVNLGVITHELRNALNRARISFQMLSKGIVGLGGSTSKVLERSLEDLDKLITRSIVEVQFRAVSSIVEETFLVGEAISHLITMGKVEASQKNKTISVDIDPTCRLKTDKLLFLSAIGNLMQNAIKFTKEGSHIEVTGVNKKGFTIVDVKDQCGGMYLLY
jgi:signal transduction histidine kinase